MHGSTAISRRAILALAAAIMSAVACAGPTHPTSVPPPPDTSSGPAPLELEISGNLSFAAIGETRQLAAAATWAGGMTSDVSADVVWSADPASTISVGPGGLVTATALGSTLVVASYRGRATSARAIVTPPGTFVVFGDVREAGSSRLSGVRVFEPQSSQSVVTDEAGRFALGGLTSPRLVFEKSGYERGEIDAAANVWSAVVLQAVMRVPIGDRISATLEPRDVGFDVGPGARCAPCRLIRLASQEPGPVRIRVQWTQPLAALNLWIDGHIVARGGPGPSEIELDLAVRDPEVLVYVGQAPGSGANPSCYVPFTLTTSRISSGF